MTDSPIKTPSVHLKALIASPYAWMIAIALIWLPMSWYSLTSYPAPYSDEAWIGSISATFLKTGHFDVPIFAGSAYNDYSTFRLYNVGLALFFRLWGVGLMQGRAFSMVGALVGGWLLFLLGRRLYGPLAGLLAMTLYLFSLRVLWLGHVVRPDMWVNVGGLACFLAFWHVRKSRQAWQLFALGALAAGVVDIYLTVVYSSIAVTLAVLIEFRRRAEWKLIGLYGLGGIVGTLIWIALRLTPDWQLHPWLMWLPGSQGEQLSLMKLSVNLIEVIVTGFIGYSRLGGLESAYIFAGLVGLLWRRQIQDRYVAFFWIILFMGDAVFRTGNHHLVYLMPISCLAIAAAIVSVANRLTQRRGGLQTSPAFIVGVLVGPLLLSYIGAGLYLAWQSRVINYGQYSSQLRSLVPAGANVFGEGTWWWALRDGLYTADEYLVISDAVPAGDTPSTLQSFLKARNVQAILLDERLGFSMTDIYRPDIYAALAGYAKTHCRLAGVVEGYAYGVEQGGPAIKRTEVFICPPP